MFRVDSDTPNYNIVAFIIATLSLKDRFEIFGKGHSTPMLVGFMLGLPPLTSTQSGGEVATSVSP